MSLLLRHRNLGNCITFRIDEPELEDLAKDLHSTTLCDESACSADVPADLIWKRAADGQWDALLKGNIWNGASMPESDLFLQTDSLLDDLIRERLGEFPLLHAGAVIDPGGRGVVICGHSGSGKTSLVISAILHGWDWLSDELLCFRDSNPFRVEGFRRNFNLKEHSFSEFPQTIGLQGNREFFVRDRQQQIRFFNPDLLPGGKFTSSGQAAIIVFPKYSPTSETAAATPLSGQELIQHLIPELRTSHARSIAWLADVTRKLPAFTVHYSQPGAAADCLANLLQAL